MIRIEDLVTHFVPPLAGFRVYVKYYVTGAQIIHVRERVCVWVEKRSNVEKV